MTNKASYLKKFFLHTALQNGTGFIWHCLIFVGLHLNLTEGSPVGDGPYKSIVGTDGFMLGKFGIRIAMAAGKIDMAEVC